MRNKSLLINLSIISITSLILFGVVETFGYFNVNIWGRVSDWIMVGVTVITAYFLYLTLRSQNLTLKMQQQQIDIETYKHKQLIKPYLTFKSHVDNVVSNEVTQSYTINLRFTFNNGEARNLLINEVSSQFFQGIKLSGLPVNSVRSSLNDSYYVKILITDHPITKEIMLPFDDIIIITLKAQFEDITGSKYEQTLHYRKVTPRNDECHSEIPVEVYD